MKHAFAFGRSPRLGAAAISGKKAEGEKHNGPDCAVHHSPPVSTICWPIVMGSPFCMRASHGIVHSGRRYLPVLLWGNDYDGITGAPKPWISALVWPFDDRNTTIAGDECACK